MVKFKRLFETVKKCVLNTKTLKWAGGGIAYTLIVASACKYLFSHHHPIPKNQVFLRPSNIQVELQKDITFKIIDGKFENEVWYQEGDIFYSEKFLSHNYPHCEVDTRKIIDEEITKPIVMERGFSTKIDSAGLGILSQANGVRMIFVSHKEDDKSLKDVAFYYVDCFIPYNYFSDNFKIDINEVERITGGAVKVIQSKYPKHRRPSSHP